MARHKSNARAKFRNGKWRIGERRAKSQSLEDGEVSKAPQAASQRAELATLAVSGNRHKRMRGGEKLGETICGQSTILGGRASSTAPFSVPRYSRGRVGWVRSAGKVNWQHLDVVRERQRSEDSSEAQHASS